MEGSLIVPPAERNDDCGLQLDKNTDGANRYETLTKGGKRYAAQNLRQRVL